MGLYLHTNNTPTTQLPHTADIKPPIFDHGNLRVVLVLIERPVFWTDRRGTGIEE